jgi:hypothetical protein
LSGGDHRWFKRRTREKRPITGDNDDGYNNNNNNNNNTVYFKELYDAKQTQSNFAIFKCLA